MIPTHNNPNGPGGGGPKKVGRLKSPCQVKENMRFDTHVTYMWSRYTKMKFLDFVVQKV